MRTNIIKINAIWIGLLAFTLWGLPISGSHADRRNFPETIGILSELHAKGITSWHKYKSYEVKAQADGYPALASMFAAMAASQSVTTDQFRRLLGALGEHRPMCFDLPSIAKDTKANLKSAIEMEFLETDVTFPRALRKLSAEGHAEAIRSLQLILDAQHHHRRILESVYPYTGFFFNAFTSEIEKRNPVYFICRQTGAVILNTLPSNCPVRGGATTAYIELLDFQSPDTFSSCAGNVKSDRAG